MDEKLRELERQASQGDEEAIAAVRRNTVRSLDGWQRKMHDNLEMIKRDPITSSIFPQIIKRDMPLEERWLLYDSMVQDLLPKWHNNVAEQVQDVVDKKWDEVNKFSSDVRPTLYRDEEEESWWPNWDHGGTSRLGARLDTYIRALAGIRIEGLVDYNDIGNTGEAKRRIDDEIHNFYYGLNTTGGRVQSSLAGVSGKTVLRDMLMKKLEEMVYA